MFLQLLKHLFNEIIVNGFAYLIKMKIRLSYSSKRKVSYLTVGNAKNVMVYMIFIHRTQHTMGLF